jgi:Xaa-Pro aminopeptidase
MAVRIASVANRRTRIENLDPALGKLRLVKDTSELSRLRRAVAITSEALKESMRLARPGVWEYELEAIIEYTFRRMGAERVGFPSIVASGPNAVTLHYDDNRRQTQAGDLVVEDVGAEFGYYSADITRTLPVSGRFTSRQRALYDLVLGTQQAAIDAVRPGTTLAALNRIARSYMREHSGDLCGSDSCVPYFIHGLSHWLGMDVHDVGSFSSRLEPGMVLTVEPGIYIPAERLGVRIEDDVVVTADGHELLSRAAPRTATEIEAIMAHGLP